jgi:hypothetical protein
VIDSQGGCNSEIIRGKLEPLTYGTASPIMELHTDPFLGSFKYEADENVLDPDSMEFIELKTAVQKTLNCVPEIKVRDPHIHYQRFGEKSESNETKIKHPGYYEIIFTRFPDENGEREQAELSPIFLDFRDSEKYQLPAKY